MHTHRCETTRAPVEVLFKLAIIRYSAQDKVRTTTTIKKIRIKITIMIVNNNNYDDNNGSSSADTQEHTLLI